MSVQGGDLRVKTASGETYIAATQRPDGSWRKPRKVKSGYIPQEEQPKFESRAQQVMRQCSSTLKFPVGFSPLEMQKKSGQQSSTSRAALSVSTSQPPKKPVAAVVNSNVPITPQDHIQKKINGLHKKLSEIDSLKMLGKLVKEHATKQQIRKEMQEKKKNEAIVAAHLLSNAVVEHLNRSVSHAYNNQKRIDVESKRMQNFAVSLTKFAEGWIGLIDSFNATLKQVGDVKSWANVIDNDITIVVNTLKEVSEVKTKGSLKANNKAVDLN